MGLIGVMRSDEILFGIANKKGEFKDLFGIANKKGAAEAAPGEKLGCMRMIIPRLRRRLRLPSWSTFQLIRRIRRNRSSDGGALRSWQ